MMQGAAFTKSNLKKIASSALKMARFYNFDVYLVRNQITF